MSNETNKLKELKGSGYEIVDGEPDIIGWDVQNNQGQKIGDVNDLLFDESSRKVRYLIVDVDDDFSGSDDNRKVLIPVGLAVLHEKDDDVLVPSLTTEQLALLPEYKKDSLDATTENKIRNVFGAVGATGVASEAMGSTSANSDDFYAHDHFNEDRMYENRKAVGEQTIPIIEENLNVGKRLMQTGGVRVTSNIVEQPVQETVNLKEERVTVERTPVNKPLTEGSFAPFEETTIELTEKAEVPVVSKEARVVEEVSVDMEVNHRDETIQDTVRRTEVEIEEIDKNKLKGNI